MYYTDIKKECTTMRAVHNLDTGTTVCLDCMRVNGKELDKMLEDNESLIILSPGMRKMKEGVFPYGEECGICGGVVLKRSFN